MKLLAFTASFGLVAACAIPSLAAADAEPVGATAGLALFGVLMLGVCIAAWGAMGQRAGVAPGHWLSACAGAICSATLHASLALALAMLAAYPGLPFNASAACAPGVALLLPRLFQAAARRQ